MAQIQGRCSLPSAKLRNRTPPLITLVRVGGRGEREYRWGPVYWPPTQPVYIVVTGAISGKSYVL